MGLRQNIQQIDHVALVYHPENAEKAMAGIAAALGVTFEPVEPSSPGFHVWKALDAGLEVFAPHPRSDIETATGSHKRVLEWFYSHLDKHGEGFFSLAFGVADMDAAIERAKSNGVEVGDRWTEMSSWITSRFDHFEETEVGEIGGVYWLLAKVIPNKEELAKREADRGLTASA